MSTDSTQLPRFIAIVGREVSGKDSYGNYLAERGYMHISAGDFIRAQARAQGYADPIPRSVLSKIGDEMKKKFGPGPITKATLNEYEQKQADFPAGLVISGFRRVEEVKAFKSLGAVVIWIDVDDNKRFSYQSQRDRGDQQAFSDFVESGKREYFGSTNGGQDGVNLQAVEALADYRVKNDGSLEELFKNADSMLSNSIK
jgi:dephospho-CoA kinase